MHFKNTVGSAIIYSDKKIIVIEIIWTMFAVHMNYFSGIVQYIERTIKTNKQNGKNDTIK